MRLIQYRRPDLGLWPTNPRLTSLRDLVDSAFQLASTLPGPITSVWSPPLDLYEDENNYFVRLELAGLKKDDFSLSLESEVLTISGERKEASEKRGESLRSERFFGSFSRSVTLPAPVQADKVSAKYQDGVLTVTLPKAEAAKPKKIEVQIS